MTNHTIGYTPSNDVFENGYLNLDEQILDVGEIKLKFILEDRYGGEGQGDDHWFVLYFPEHDIYLRAGGWYQSYSGSDYTGAKWEHVIPKQVTVTKYEPVSKTTN